MATRVPVLEGPQRQFQPITGTQFTSDANAELLGGPTARNLASLGKNMDDIAAVITRQENQDNLNAVLNQDVLLGNVLIAEQRKALLTKGKNSQGILASSEALYDRNFETHIPTDDGEIEESDVLFSEEFEREDQDALTPERKAYLDSYHNLTGLQKGAFDFNKAKARSRWLNNIANHEDAERIAFTLALQGAAIDNRIENAALNATDDALIKQTSQEISRIVAAGADAQGVPGEVAEKANALAQSNLHSRVIRSLLASDQTGKAKDYFAQNKGSLVGGERATLEKLINDDVDLGKAQVNADRIFPMPRDKWQDELRKIKDPDVRNLTRQQINAQDGLKTKQQVRERNDALKTAYAILRDEDRLLLQSQGLRALPHEIRERMTAQDAEVWLTNLRGLTDINPPDQTIHETMGEIRRMSVSSDPKVVDRFLNMTLEHEYAGKLDTQHMDSAQILQQKMIAAKGKQDPTLLTMSGQLGAKFDAIGWTGPDFARHRGVVSDVVFQAVNQLEQAGVNPTQSQIQEIITSALNPGQIDRLQTRFGRPDVVDAAAGTFTTEQLLSTQFRATGISRKDHPETTAAIEQKARKDITAWENQNGKDVPDHIAQEIVKRVANNRIRVVDSFGFDEDILLAELNDEDFPLAYVNAAGKKVMLTELWGLDQGTRDQYARELRANGEQTTVQNIAEMHVFATQEVEREAARQNPPTLIQPLPTASVLVEPLERKAFIGRLRQTPLGDLPEARKRFLNSHGPDAARIVDQVIREKQNIGEGEG